MHPIIQQLFHIIETDRYSMTDVSMRSGYNANYLSENMRKGCDPGFMKIADIAHTLGYTLTLEKTHEPLIPPAKAQRGQILANRAASRARLNAAIEHFKSRGSLMDYERAVLRNTDEPAGRPLLRPKRLRNVAGRGRGGDTSGLPSAQHGRDDSV